MADDLLPNAVDDSFNETASNPASGVMLPDVSSRKSTIATSNSWAQPKETPRGPPRDTSETLPTNRDKYEANPSMQRSLGDVQAPPLPPKVYLQPAIPLANTRPLASKNRAVTDPIQFRSLLTNRKPSVSQLKKKGKIFEFGSSKVDLTDGTNLPHHNIAPKALLLLGVQTESTPSRTSADAGIDPSPKAFGQSQSKLKSAHEFPLEPEHYKTPRAGTPAKELGSKAQAHAELTGGDTLMLHGLQHAKSNGHLHPPKVPIYGNVGKQHNIVEQHGIHSSGSFHGIIETTSPVRMGNDPLQRQPEGTPTKIVQGEASDEFLRPTVYSPGHNSSGWGDRHAVDHLNPPFTPIPETGHPNYEHVPKGLAVSTSDVFANVHIVNFPYKASTNHEFQAPQMHDKSAATAPHKMSKDQGAQPPTSFHQIAPQSAQQGLHQAIFNSRTQSVFDHMPLKSANSWAPSKDIGPSSSSGSHSSFIPPRWPVHFSHNPVPSPPASQQDYQRPSPLSAGLAQLDLTLHHHIDSVFGSLSRQIADKHDRILDRVLLRIDSFEDTMCKEMKDLRADFNSIRKDIGKLRALVSEISHGHGAFFEGLQTLSVKVDKLEQSMTVAKDKAHIKFADQCSKESNIDGLLRQSIHRRAESAHGSLGSSPRHGNPCVAFDQGRSAAEVAARQSSSLIRHSGNSDQEEMVPNLKDHPAYRQQHKPIGEARGILQQDQGAYGSEGLVDGNWYHQAYGISF